jgi:serine protease AprX
MKMIGALVDDGVSVVFSASNLGGDGSDATTSLECTHPAPGVVCVASYNDMDIGSRTGSISPTSSRGDIGDPRTWPDISAPGSVIVSTCRVTLPVCTAYGEERSPDSLYAILSGTSMAAPHVSGVIALLYQARPSLTPAQVEDVVEDTAYKFRWGAPYEPDPFNGNDKSSFEKGHGLIDALAAIRKILAEH